MPRRRRCPQCLKAKLINDTEVARAKREFDLKKAEYDVEVNTAKAEAELAYALQVGAPTQAAPRLTEKPEFSFSSF